MAQDHPEKMRPLPFALRQHPCPLAKIHLGFGPGSHFHSHKGHGLPLQQLPHEPLDGMITTAERMLTNQVLIDPLGREPRRYRRFNDRRQRLA